MGQTGIIGNLVKHVLVFSVDSFEKKDVTKYEGQNYGRDYVEKNILKEGVELYTLENFVHGLNEQIIDIENSWVAIINIPEK